MEYKTNLAAVLFLAIAACVSTKLDEAREDSANPTDPAPSMAVTKKTDGAAMRPDHHDHAKPAPSDSAARSPALSASPAPPRHARAPAGSPPVSAVWTCTMHPEIAKNGPGDCPICGMSLAKRSAGQLGH
jgi:hypothetical protein